VEVPFHETDPTNISEQFSFSSKSGEWHTLVPKRRTHPKAKFTQSVLEREVIQLLMYSTEIGVESCRERFTFSNTNSVYNVFKLENFWNPIKSNLLYLRNGWGNFPLNISNQNTQSKAWNLPSTTRYGPFRIGLQCESQRLELLYTVQKSS
jgi:hypothetical protein